MCVLQLVLLAFGFPMWCVWEWFALWFYHIPLFLRRFQLSQVRSALRTGVVRLQRLYSFAAVAATEFGQSLFWYGYEQYHLPAKQWVLERWTAVQANFTTFMQTVRMRVQMWLQVCCIERSIHLLCVILIYLFVSINVCFCHFLTLTTAWFVVL